MAATKKTSLHKFLIVIGLVIAVEIIIILVLLTQNRTIAVLEPAGTIAEQQRDLIVFASALSLLVVVPVFLLLGYILWRYREGNISAKYRPNWDGNAKLESIWWGIPTIIIVVLAIVTWQTSHSLDPYKPLESSVKPVRVQVVALQWKWLFIYPDQKIATINYLRIPENTPINFEITSDAPMNSFWIPQLGGQVYAMPGMTTQLHLMADKQGSFNGSSANISGEGFSGMRFVVDATTTESFESWINQVQESTDQLTQERYDTLRKPSSEDKVMLFAKSDAELYTKVIDKYMSHEDSNKDASHMKSEGASH